MRERQSSVAVSPASWSPASTIRHFGGDETLVRELVGLFLKSCPRLLDNLRTRLRENDLTALGKAAHALKGSIGNFTTDGPAATAFELERLCGLGRRDAAAEALQRLEHEVAGLMSAMQAFHEDASTCGS